MAPPIVSETNWASWQGWQPIYEPGTGREFRVVPGYGNSYVFDPYESAATGRYMIYKNPSSVYEAAAKAQKDQEKQGSLASQAALPLGVVAGGVGARWVSDKVSNMLADKAAEQVVGQAAPQAGQAFAQGANQIAMGGSNAGGGAVAAGGQLGGGAGMAGRSAYLGKIPSGGAVEGGGMFNKAGSFISNNPLIGGALGGIGLGLGAKGVYDAYESGDLLSGGISGAGAGLGASMLSGAMGGSTFGPVGMAVGGLLGLGAAALGGRTTTAEHQQANIEGLRKEGKVSEGTYNALNQMNQQDAAGDGVWTSGKYAGEKWSFDKALDLAKEDPSHFAHVYGNYATFGQDYENLPIDKKMQVVSALANNDLYKSQKGDVFIKDEAKAKEIFNQVVTGAAPQASQAFAKGMQLDLKPVENTKPITQNFIGSLSDVNLGAANRSLTTQNKPAAQQPTNTPPMTGGFLDSLMNMTPEQRAQVIAYLNSNQPLGQGKPASLFGGQ